jgi:2-dehydropantoate 2-reductase
VTIAIYGAGAVGLVVGARLARAGEDVLFVTRRPEVARRIEREGVRFEDPGSGEAFVARARAVAGAAATHGLLGEDPVLFCMRASQTAESAAALAPAAPRASAVSLQNDLDNDPTLARFFARVTGAPLRQSCTRTADNAAAALGGGRIVLGAHPRGRRPDVEELASRLRAAGYEVGVSERLREDRWLKLCVNLMSAPNALIRRSDHRTRAFVELKARLLEEARGALAAAGIAARSCDGRDRSLDEEIAWQRASLDAGSSARELPIFNQVWAALRHGGPLEADGYHRRILGLAADHGLPAPVNARVLDVLERCYRAGRGPECVGAEELLGK